MPPAFLFIILTIVRGFEEELVTGAWQNESGLEVTQGDSGGCNRQFDRVRCVLVVKVIDDLRLDGHSLMADTDCDRRTITRPPVVERKLPLEADRWTVTRCVMRCEANV